MISIHHQIAIIAPIDKVYAALASADGISTWWDKQTPVQTDHGLVLEHNPGTRHGVVKLKVLDLIPNKRVEWECISNHPLESPASAWMGTHFVFEFTEQESPASIIERECNPSGTEDKRITTVDFRQTNYDEQNRYAGFNNFAWALVLNNLKAVCEGQD